MLTALAVILSICVEAQVKKAIDTVQMEPKTLSEVIVFANKFPEKLKYITQTIKVIKDKNALNNQPNAGDVLLNSAAVFVQKSQPLITKGGTDVNRFSKMV